MRRRKERTLYPLIKRFLQKEVGCFKVDIKKGSQDLGQVDVIGVKSIGKELTNDFEVIVVEVKTDLNRFGIKIGQTLGYSVFANRCYLAVDGLFNTFKEENKDFATQLRVGLIEVGKLNCKEIISAPILIPSEYQKRFILEKLGLVCCALCRNYMDKSGHSKKSHKSIQEGKPYLLHGTRDYPDNGKIFLCPNCVESLSKIQQPSMIEQRGIMLENRIKENKIKNKLSKLKHELKNLNFITEIPRKSHLCYRLKHFNFLEIFIKQNKFIVNILTKKRKIKDEDHLLKKTKWGSKKMTIDKNTDIESVIKTIKSAYKREGEE